MKAHGHRVFGDEDEAMTLLGVGKNMVRSIRHWCLAAQVLREVADEQGRRLVPTVFGESLLSDSGFDPFLEDFASLWLIHWKLATNAERATSWFVLLSGWNQPEFTKEAAKAFISERLVDNGIIHVADVSIDRDITVFIRTYVPTKRSNTVLLEESLDCPLIELQLINLLADGKTYRVNRTNHSTLPDLILAYMIAEFWNLYHPYQDTLSFEDIMYRPGSPGRITRLVENAMIERLERMDTVTQGAFYFTASSGLRQLYRGQRALPSPDQLLRDYYWAVRRDDDLVSHTR